MPTRAGPGDPKVVGIDTIRGGIVPNEPHRAVEVVDHFRDNEPGLRTVNNGKYGVAGVQEEPDRVHADRHHVWRIPAREPATAYEKDHRTAIAARWLKHIQGQRGSKLAAVDNILGALVRQFAMGLRSERYKADKANKR